MSNNLPYQRYIDRRYFVVKESVFEVEGMKKDLSADVRYG